MIDLRNFSLVVVESTNLIFCRRKIVGNILVIFTQFFTQIRLLICFKQF
jgi:hypothetical protein